MSPLPSASLFIGLVQLNSGENIQSNENVVLESVQKLAAQKAELICFPENSLYLRIDKSKKAIVGMDLTEPFWGRLQEEVNGLGVHVLLGSVPYRSQGGGKLYNSTIHIQPGGRGPEVVYNKIHLFDVDVDGAPPSRESDDFHHGEKPRMLTVKDWRIGLSICYDVRFSELYQDYARNNAHLIMVPAAFLVPTGRAHWHVLLRARAIESQAYVVAAAQAGEHRAGESTRYTFGHSLVVAPWGEVLVDLENPGYDCRVIELTPDRLSKTRKQIPMSGHRQLE